MNLRDEWKPLHRVPLGHTFPRNSFDFEYDYKSDPVLVVRFHGRSLNSYQRVHTAEYQSNHAIKLLSSACYKTTFQRDYKITNERQPEAF